MKGRQDKGQVRISQLAMVWLQLHQRPAIQLGKAFHIHVVVYTARQKVN